MSRRDFKGSIFWLIKQSRLKLWLLIIDFFLIHSCVNSTGFGSLLSKFILKRKLTSRISRNIWKKPVCSIHCLFQYPVCVSLSHVEILFLLNLFFALLVKTVGKVAPSVKFISSNHHSSMTTFRLYQSSKHTHTSLHSYAKTYQTIQGKKTTSHQMANRPVD